METRKLSVIMFTDIVGYSKKVHENEAQALRLLSEHNNILNAQIKAYKGNVIKTVGDAYLANFDSVFDAVNCAADIQKHLAERNTGAADDRIEIRIGIHVGDVIYRDNDVFGDGVNIASRIQSIADGGQVFISHDVFSITYGKLEHTYKDIGSKDLKNINRPVHVYEVLWDPARAGEATKRPPIVPRTLSPKSRVSRALAAGAVGVAALILLYVWSRSPNQFSHAPKKPTLAVVSFGDETGDENLKRVQIGKIINNAVVQKFYEFPHVQLVSPLQISKAMKELDIQKDRLAQDPGLAETIARETNGRLMVAGTLSKLGSSFILSANLNDLAKEKLLANFVLKETSEENILGSLIDSLCTKFQQRITRAFQIEESVPYKALSIGELTTPSLEAYAHFVKGNDLYKSGNFQTGVKELTLATEIDSNFALAYSLLACAYSLTKNAGDDQLSAQYFKKARKFRSRFTGISKGTLIFRGNDAWYDENLEECAKNYRLITELYPDDRDGYYYYGLYFAYLKHNDVEAIKQYRKAIELSPEWYPTYRDMAYSLDGPRNNSGLWQAICVISHPDSERRSFALL